MSGRGLGTTRSKPQLKTKLVTYLNKAKRPKLAIEPLSISISTYNSNARKEEKHEMKDISEEEGEIEEEDDLRVTLTKPKTNPRRSTRQKKDKKEEKRPRKSIFVCPNRVVTNGITVPLQVFRDPKKGWGVWCLTTLKTGTYICSYVGEVLTAQVADLRRGTEDGYLMDCDDHLDRAELAKRQTHNEDDDHLLVIDAKRYGGVARYINHSCDPNLSFQSTNLGQSVEFLQAGFIRPFSWIAFFTNKNIPPLTELTIDYGYVANSLPGKSLKCECKAENCRGQLL